MASVDRPDRPAAEALADRRQDGAVDLVEAALVDAEGGQAVATRWRRSTAPSPLTSAKSRTRRSRRLAMRGVPRARRAISQAPSASTLHAEDPGGPGDDVDEVVGLVVVEAGDEAEAVAERAGDRAGAGGGADEREARQVEADRPGGRALAEHDVDLEVLHRRVEDLLDDPRAAGGSRR